MKKFAIVLGIILGIAVIGLGAVAAYDYTILRDLFGLGLSRNPATAVKQVYTNMTNLNSYHVENQSFVKATIPTGGVDTQTLSLPISTSLDYIKPDKAQLVADVKLQDIIDKVIPLLSPSMTGGINIKEVITEEIKKQLAEIKIDIILLQNKAYIKTPLLSKDDWIEISQTNDINLKDQMGNLNISQYTTGAEKLNDEVINGVKCYHYQYKIDPSKALSLPTLKNIPQAELDTVKNTLKNIEPTVDLYVGKKDLLIHKEKILFKIVTPFLFETNIEDNYSNFNKVTDIKSPTNAKKMESITITDLAVSPIGQIILKVYTPDAKTRDIKRKSDLKVINNALKQYATDHQGKYPILTDTSKDSKFLEIFVPKYLSKVPVDPLNNSEYFYSYKSSDGTTYVLSCNLENKSDSESKDGTYQLTK